MEPVSRYPLKDFLGPPLLLLVVIIDQCATCSERCSYCSKNSSISKKAIIRLLYVFSKATRDYIHLYVFIPSIPFIYILYTIVKYKQFMRRDMAWTHGPCHAYNVSSY